MGLEITSLRYHCWLKKNGTKFDTVATLGRQAFQGLNSLTLSKTVAKFGFKMSISEAESILTEQGGYAEPFYKWLGASSIVSFDYSSYEGATSIWDMNLNLNQEFQGKFDFVSDGGTLEHIFNYASALREAMTLPKIGGIFLSATPANSYLGHGFYQFGPDLPFSILKPQNGYGLGGIHLIEMRNKAIFFEVLPPEKSRGRALASTSWPALMYFWGKRTGEIPARLTAMEPNYESVWIDNTHDERPDASKGGMLRHISNLLPNELQTDFLRLIKLGYTVCVRNAFFDQSSFKPNRDI